MKPIWLLRGLGVVLVGFAVLMFITWNMFLRSSTLTTGTVTDAYLIKGDDLPIFTFTAQDGKTYQVRNDRNDLCNEPCSFWKIGDTTEVRYVTKNPIKARAGQKTWTLETILVVLGTILLFAKVGSTSDQEKA